MRANIGKLPSLNAQTTVDIKEKQTLNTSTRNQFRNRKLSTSIREMEANFFATELDEHKITDYNEREVKMFRPEFVPKR